MYEQIKYLCSRIHTVEWSGVLFYKVEGTIKDPSNMKITLVDILPMDKGSTATTSFNMDSRYDDYLMEEHPEYLENGYQTALIHSHHNMEVYFSSTDDEELIDNTKTHNYYLSLIVNNNMDFVAKVAFRGEIAYSIPVLDIQALDENGTSYKIADSKEKIYTQSQVYAYDCDIEVEDTSTVDKSFISKVNGICKTVVKGVSNKVKKFTPSKPNKKTFSLQDVYSEEFWEDDLGNDFTHSPFDALGSTEESPFDKAIIQTLLCGQTPKKSDTLDSVLNRISLNEYDTEQMITNRFEAYYPAVYESCFGDSTDDKEFILNTQEIIDRIDEQESYFPIMSGAKKLLIAMLNIFEEQNNG